MAAITVADLDPGLVARLDALARRNGRTLEAEARAILEAAVPAADSFWERARAVREQLAATGRTFPDSAELIREDRDR